MTDSLRLAIVPADIPGGGFAVEVYVNGTEMTSLGAGLGADPYDLLIPENRLLATPEPRKVQIARCACGDYGCRSTDVTITRDGDLVRWEWRFGAPMTRPVAFEAARYDAEVERAAGDHAWETAERIVGRLVLSHVDRDALAGHDLAVSEAANNYYEPEQFRVALLWRDEYQIFVDTPWQNRSPAELAAEICEILARGPGTWRASWHRMTPVRHEPPAIATRAWRREPL